MIALTFDACGGPGGSVFELANHGTRHLPLSVTGRSAYGIGGTRDAGEVYDEVATNQVKLTRLLGPPPRYSGPAPPTPMMSRRRASRRRSPS